MFIRADASTEIGTGHIMRCLALAEALRDSGIQCRFISRELPGNLNHLIVEKGYALIPLPALASTVSWETDAEQTLAILSEEVDWIIVDHYELDLSWEQAIQPYVRKIVVIDDWAHRLHACDVLINANVYDAATAEVQRSNVPSHCLTLLGPAHAPLRREFREAAQHPRVRDGCVGNLLVSFGGSDHTNQTSKVLQALQRLPVSIQIDVVVGDASPYRAEIQHLCSGSPQVKLHFQSDQMAYLMSNADLCIGSLGTSSWERCYLGLPAICMTVASNQLKIAEYLYDQEAIMYLGWFEDITVEDIVLALKQAIEHPSMIARMSDRSRHIMKDYDQHAAGLIPLLLSNEKAVYKDE